MTGAWDRWAGDTPALLIDKCLRARVRWGDVGLCWSVVKCFLYWLFVETITWSFNTLSITLSNACWLVLNVESGENSFQEKVIFIEKYLRHNDVSGNISRVVIAYRWLAADLPVSSHVASSSDGWEEGGERCAATLTHHSVQSRQHSCQQKTVFTLCKSGSVVFTVHTVCESSFSLSMFQIHK